MTLGMYICTPKKSNIIVRFMVFIGFRLKKIDYFIIPLPNEREFEDYNSLTSVLPLSKHHDTNQYFYHHLLGIRNRLRCVEML
jgi:hypothetical protein